MSNFLPTSFFLSLDAFTYSNQNYSDFLFAFALFVFFLDRFFFNLEKNWYQIAEKILQPFYRRNVDQYAQF